MKNRPAYCLSFPCIKLNKWPHPATNHLRTVHWERRVKRHRLYATRTGQSGFPILAGALVCSLTTGHFLQLVKQRLCRSKNAALLNSVAAPGREFLLGRRGGRAKSRLAQFQGVRSTVKERREGGQLRVCVNSAVQVTDDGRVVPHDEAKAFDVVILAVGFGDRGAAFRSSLEQLLEGRSA